MSDSDDNATAAVEGTGEAGQPPMNSAPMSAVHAHPRAHEAVRWADRQDWHGNGPEPSTPEDLFTRDALVDAYCAGADAADEAWDDQRRVGQAQLDLATAVIREGAQLTRFYEVEHRNKLLDPAVAADTEKVHATIAKANRNGHMAARFEAWLRGDERLPLPAPSIPGLNPADAMRHVAEAVTAGTPLTVDHASFSDAAARMDQVVEIDFPGVTSLETARRQADARRSNLRPVTDGALADPVIVEGLLAAAGMLDATDPDAAPVRLQGVADLVAFRLNTGDPRFDPSKPVCVNGFLYHPATKD